MPVPPSINNLVQRFEEQLPSYRSGRYNETELRRDFLDPFLSALGWDVTNQKGSAEKYREVIHEISVEVEGQAKAADYAIRAGDKAVFLVEAKKPSVNIGTNPEPAFQIRRYGWSAKLPINLLTDFEQLALYDCRSKPVAGDSPAIGRIKLYHFKEYVEKWDEIAGVFSRDAVYQGSFDKYAEGMKGKRGTADVDDDFLSEMERWREDLARNIALRNQNLSSREINAAVQTTIDRIIFLRICEERGIEPEDSLRNATDGKEVYQDLMVLFQQADRKYNSGLFHFSPEKNQTSQPDTLAPRLKIDDKVLKDILKHLYYPDSPYAFKYIPADILGSVYERFLGKVITLTPGHHAKVEEKPEVRKAGGVYYTPTYIVEYIVKNTVGELLKDTTAEEQKAKPIRIVDPACGSGSFLLGAYQYLLDWYLNWYTSNDPGHWAKGRNPAVFEGRDGWQLTMEEKKGILTRHIFGVDIDAQAVEVTKLSLLLKVVENPGQLSLLDERILPDLGRNIQCGNSLIGPDYFDNQQLTMFDQEEQYRVNAFDWHKAFPQVFSAPSVLRTSPPNSGNLEEQKGGFDAVIGNPPYGATIQPIDKEYFRNNYEVKDFDTYSLFIELAINLSKINGMISMIIPTGWYSGANFGILRRLFASKVNPRIFVNLPYDIFGAWIDTSVFVASKREDMCEWPKIIISETKIVTFPKRYQIQSIEDFNGKESYVDISQWFIYGEDTFLTYTDINVVKIISKINDIGIPLSKIADIQRGVTPFQLTDDNSITNSKLAFTGTVRRYSLFLGQQEYIRYDNSLAEYKPERYFVGKRLLLRELISRQFRLQAVKVEHDFITNKSMQSILMLDGLPDLNYILGIINSKLLSWYFLRRSNIAQRDDFPKIVLKETRSLPIRPINFSYAADATKHDRMVALVENMLSLHKRLSAAGLPQEKEMLQRQIDQTDRQIDALVYELYGLTEEEIKIVEGG